MSQPNVPVVNEGLLYINGLQIAWNSTTLLTLSAGQARDSSDTTDINLPQIVTAGSPVVQNGLPLGATINGAVVGVNGVDVAVLAADVIYAVYVIYDSNQYQPAAGLLSLASNAQPYLPFGYDSYRRVGWAVTDSASHLAKFWQYAHNDQTRKYYWDVPAAVLAAGAATTFTAVALNAASTTGAGIPGVPVPPRTVEVVLDASLAGAATASFLPFGSSATNGIVRFASAGAAISPVVVPSQLNSGVPTIQYKVSASTVTLLVIGFTDNP